MPSTVYVETSVVSYLTSSPSRQLVVAGHQQMTHEWWATHRHAFSLYTSQLVLREAAAGDPKMAAERLKRLEEVPALEVTDPAASLAKALLSAGAPPPTAPEDALHIAVSVVHGLE